MEIFNNEDYKFISEFIEQKLPVLKENKNFKAEYLKLSDNGSDYKNEPH